MQGQHDSPLTPLGLQQARRLARRLKGASFGALYSSDLGRAHQTARCIADETGHEIIAERDLRERSFGIFEGCTHHEIESRYPEHYELFARRDPDFAMPGGESASQFRDRCVACLEAIARRHRPCDDCRRDARPRARRALPDRVPDGARRSSRLSAPQLQSQYVPIWRKRLGRARGLRRDASRRRRRDSLLRRERVAPSPRFGGAMATGETVVLVHGLWMHGLAMRLIARRVRPHGYATLAYSYPTVRLDLSGNAERLHAYCSAARCERVHFVGHSMGGLVALAAACLVTPERRGRVVLLGSPYGDLFSGRQPRGASRRGAGCSASAWREWLGEAHPAVPEGLEVGVIAGDGGFGMGRVIAPRLPQPHDGVIAVDETRVPGNAGPRHTSGEPHGDARLATVSRVRFAPFSSRPFRSIRGRRALNWKHALLPHRHRDRHRASVIAGCTNLPYYLQSVRGQLDIWNRQQDIEAVIANPETAAPLRTQLQAVLSIRDFASAELALPRNRAIARMPISSVPMSCGTYLPRPSSRSSPASGAFHSQGA